jgi:two-component system, chemotaxis family, protein-glutamate methylesterase/glutaminase
MSEQEEKVIRVLIVDDSKTAREAIKAMLKGEPDIEIVGEATDGALGVEMATQLKPDVITMDINMPRMNGHDATVQIMAQCPTPIVVVSTVSQEELVHQGLDILLAGALEIVQKPSSLGSMEAIQSELVAKVKAVSQVKFSQTNETE